MFGLTEDGHRMMGTVLGGLDEVGAVSMDEVRAVSVDEFRAVSMDKVRAVSMDEVRAVSMDKVRAEVVVFVAVWGKACFVWG